MISMTIKSIWLRNASNVYYSYYLCMPFTTKWNIEYPKWIFFVYIILWYSATKIYSFLPFLGLQDSLLWSGYLEMFIKNGFLHGVLQGFPHCFIQLLMFQNFSFSVASILSSISWWPVLTKIFPINSLTYLFSQEIYIKVWF